MAKSVQLRGAHLRTIPHIGGVSKEVEAAPGNPLGLLTGETRTRRAEAEFVLAICVRR